MLIILLLCLLVIPFAIEKHCVNARKDRIEAAFSAGLSQRHWSRDELDCAAKEMYLFVVAQLSQSSDRIEQRDHIADAVYQWIMEIRSVQQERKVDPHYTTDIETIPHYGQISSEGKLWFAIHDLKFCVNIPLRQENDNDQTVLTLKQVCFADGKRQMELFNPNREWEEQLTEWMRNKCSWLIVGTGRSADLRPKTATTRIQVKQIEHQEEADILHADIHLSGEAHEGGHIFGNDYSISRTHSVVVRVPINKGERIKVLENRQTYSHNQRVVETDYS